MTDRDHLNAAAEHETVRELLALAAAGAAGEQGAQRVQRHLAACAACAAEWESFRSLTHALRRLPTPQPSAALVERTRAQMTWELAAETERSWDQRVMVFVVLFSWTVTLASWPVVRALAGGLMTWLDPSFQQTWVWLLVYTGLAWVTAGVAAIILAVRQRRERSMA